MAKYWFLPSDYNDFGIFLEKFYVMVSNILFVELSFNFQELFADNVSFIFLY